MSLLDVSTYDMSTPNGQNQAIQAILQEQNNQFETSSQLNYFNVIAYKQLVVTIPSGAPNAVYSTTFRHGLNYAPSVLSYLLPLGNVTDYFTIPFIEVSESTPHNINSYSYVTIDDTNVNLNVLIAEPNLSVDPLITTAAIYVFNIPAQV